MESTATLAKVIAQILKSILLSPLYIFCTVNNSIIRSNSLNIMVITTCGKVHHTFLDTTNTTVTENQSKNYSPNSYSKSKIW